MVTQNRVSDLEKDLTQNANIFLNLNMLIPIPQDIYFIM